MANDKSVVRADATAYVTHRLSSLSRSIQLHVETLERRTPPDSVIASSIEEIRSELRLLTLALK